MNPTPRILDASSGLSLLFDELQSKGYRLIGPLKRDGAIIYDRIGGVDELPRGWTDVQDGGQYRLEKRNDDAYFGYAVGPTSPKRFLHPSHQDLWHVERQDGRLSVTPVATDTPRYAFIGVRACEIHGMEVQDRVLMGDAYEDPHYTARRRGNFVVAVNCGQAGGTCFCVSMKTGPKATQGYDLALTELLDSNRHDFLVEIGSEQGAEIMAGIPVRAATGEDMRRATAVSESAASQMGRAMDADNVRDVLLRNLDHGRWNEVAERCLSCGNCTSVCPTCFCARESDSSDLSGDHAVHSRQWDSCFTLDFSYLHGGSVRQSTKSRYRQWMTHKLATWVDQFGTSGCVGCGRCITWCPVGIDITEEVRVLQESEASDDR